MKDEYSDMLEKYNLLLEENKKLKAELALLKDKTGLVMPEAEATPQISISSINKHSSPEEKINLFRSLFKGREDVFARRWYSKTTDKSGYQPVCENEWNEELCDKKKQNFTAFKGFNTSLTKRSKRNRYHTPARKFQRVRTRNSKRKYHFITKLWSKRNV